MFGRLNQGCFVQTELGLQGQSLRQVLPSEQGGVSHRSSLLQQVVCRPDNPPLMTAEGAENIFLRLWLWQWEQMRLIFSWED